MMTPDEILRQADEQIAARKKQESAPQAAMQASEVKQEPRYLSETDMGFDAPARGFSGWARDVGATALKGAIAVPEAAVGLMDIPTGGRVGKFLENKDGAFGFRPKEAKEAVNEWHSDATKQAQQKFQQADGLVDKFGVALENPSLVATAVGESIPSMMAGGVVARGFLGAAKAGAFGNAAAKAADTTKGAVLAGAAGEGATMAGAQASAIRQETEDGLLTPGQSGAALATGAIGAALGYGGGKLADRLGIGNVDTMLAQGKQGMAKEFADSAAGAATNPAQAVAAAKSLPRQVIEGAIVEGVFEELPQSVTETVIQNLALNKPWAEGLDDAIVLGLLSGGAMGGGAAGYKGLVTPRGAGQQQPGQAPDGGAPADVAADPGAPAGTAVVGSISAASQAQEPAQVSHLFDNANAPEPFVNQSAMEAAGFAPRPPEPVLDTQRLDRALAPQKPSEAMGLDPNAGALSAAAALAVDSGASPVAPALPATAAAQAREVIDTDTGEVFPLEATGAAALSDEQLRGALRNAQSKEVRAQVVDEIRRRRDLAEQASSQEAAPAERIAQLQAQADAAEATAADWGSRDYKPNGMPLPEYEAKGGPADVGEANEQRRLKAILEAKGQAAQANAQAQALIEQGNAQAAMAAQADKAEKPSVAQLAAISRKQIPDMTDGELVALASATAADHPRKEKLAKAVQKRGLQAQAAINEGAKADGTQTNQTQQGGPQPAQAGAKKGGTQTAAADNAGSQGGMPVLSATGSTSAPGDQTTPITPNAGVEQAQAAPAAVVAAPEPRAQRVAQAGQQWAGMITAQRQEAAARANGIKPVIAKNLPKAEWGKLNADVQGKLADAMGTTPAQDFGVNQPPPRTQQEPKIKKSDAKALFSGKAMDSTRKAVPADARAMEQFIADGKEAEFQRLLSIRQTGRDNLTDEETNQFYDLRTERNQAKASVENAGYDRVKPSPPPAQSQQAQAARKPEASAATDFIPAPDGGLDYGEITPEMGKTMRRQAGKIRLRQGNEAWGLTHIENRHGKDFAALGFKSAQDFVSQVASGFTKIYKGRGTALDVVLDEQARGMLIVSLEPSVDGDFYDIKTATPIRRDQFKNETPLWERAGPSASTAVKGSSPYPKGQNGIESVPPTDAAEQPVTRADVQAAQQQAAAIIGARIDAMSAGDVNKIAKKFLPTMGMKPTMSKANNKAAMTDSGINLEAAAAEVGATLPTEVTRALQADMEGRVVGGEQRPTPQASAVAGAETAKQNAVGADDFPMNEAQRSYSGISHSGSARALGDKEAFDAFMQKAQKDVEAAQTDAQRTAAQEALQSLRADYLSAYRSLMNVRAGTYGGYVAGRGNINSKQANARNNALDKAMSRFDDWRADNANRVKRAIRDARTPEQVQQDQAALAKSIKDKAAKVRSGEKDFVRKVLGWKKGDETSVGRAGFLVGVNFDRDGYPSTLKMKAADGAKLLDDKFDLAALLRKSGESVSDAKRKVRELVDEVRAEASDGDTQSAPAAPASKTPAIDAQDVVFSQNLLSPAASGSKPAPEQIQQLVDKVQQLAKGGFLVRVTGSPVNVPGVKVPAGAKPTGAVIDGNIYLFTDNLSSIGDAYVTMFHEIFHLGLQKVLPAEDYAAVLKQFASNPLVAKFVRQWEASAEGIEKAAKMPSAAYEALATEEALAMIAEELSVNDGDGTRNMPGLAKKMLSWFAQVADKLGFPPNFSNWVRNLTRTDAERFVNDMTRAVLGGSKNLAKTKAKYGSMAAQMVDARQGFFLTSSPEIASEYAEEAGANGGANIMPAYVSLQNPLVIDEGGRDYDAERFRDYIEQAQEQGHDGVLLRNTGDGMFKNGRTGDTVIAFRSEQIKSAIGNNGQFDPANPDIRYSRMDDNAATEGVSNEQRQTPNGIPAGLPATSDPDSQYLERRINNWLQTSGWRADRLSAVSLPIELRTALDRFTDATGTRVVLFRNLTPEIEDFNGVNFRDGRVFINETSQHPATLTAAHEWVHNFRRTNPKLYQQLEDEVREQGRIPQWHQRNIKEEGMDRGIDHAIEELTAAAVSDAMTDPAFLEQLALRNQGVFRRVAQAFLDFLDTLTAGWRDQGSNAYLRDVQAFRDKLAQVLDQLPSIGQDAANFATNPARRPGSAQDKAVMQAIADGKTTRDVLRLVANGSKDPFLRQVARLLLKAGITPNIQFGYIGKTKKGNPIYGQYRGKSDTIAIAGSAEYAAERIFMHEAMHAATMRALAKPGLPKLQLQKLLEHVRKNGGADGFYGLKNVDEFVAEVFTNPDFQAALRTMSAPAGSPLKSAWHSFVQVLRRILGLGDNSTGVLSQALELGVAAVRQDMQLRRQGARASGRANPNINRSFAGQQAPRTPAATIRAAITKAYGKLLGQLESKGLVTLAQTQDEAIEAAAQARTKKTGEPVENVRERLMAGVRNSIATQRVLDADGLARLRRVAEIVSNGNVPSGQKIGLGRTPSVLQMLGALDVRLNLDPHKLTDALKPGKKHGLSVDAVVLAIENLGDPLAVMKSRTRADSLLVLTEATETDGRPMVVAVTLGKDGQVNAVNKVASVYAKDGSESFMALNRKENNFLYVNNEKRQSLPETRRLQLPLGGVASTITSDPATGVGSTIRSEKDLVNFEQGLDIKRSANGAVQGFFDPQTGQSFLIADNLTAEAAPGVLMHEVGIHMAADGSMKALFNRAALMLKMQNADPFMQRVQAHMDAAKETSNEEAAAYLVEAYENDRANAPASVRKWLADLLAAVKAWMYRKGITGAGSLTVADIAAVARANAKSFAQRESPSRAGGLDAITGQRGVDTGESLIFSRSRLADLKASAIDRVHQTMTHPGKMSLWDKTVGTMRHIAERYPAFKPVYDAAQQFIDDVASLANTAANVAPRLIPRVDSLRDMLKKPISVDDNKAIAKALFEGTLDWGRDQRGKAMPMDELRAKYAGLNVHQKAEVLLAAGKVPPQVMAMWRGQKIEQFETLIHNKFESVILKPGAEFSEKELKEFFNLNGEQISLYKEARATVAKSLDITARAEMMRHLGHDFDHLRAMVLDAPSLADAWKLLDDELESRAREVPDSRDLMADKMFQLRATVDRVQDLLKHGYMPLSRFGKYTLEVIDQDGERVYFGLFESQADSNRMALQMRNVYKGAKVTQGTMNDEKYKLFAGITPETAELFGNMLGLDEEGQDAKSKAFQEYLRMAKNNHSALKRLIHRKGTAGYSEDVGRVLASFVYSNARLAATGLNAGRMEGAIHRLNTEHKEQGELGKIAMQLREYIQDPQEEGLWLRGMLFAQYLGGSIASALVNTTQPFAVTIPWLSQYGGMAKASSYMAKAVQDMGKRAMNKGSTTYEADLAAALKQAEDDGVVSPQEIHQLMAQARGAGGLRTGDGTKLGNARAQASNYWEKVKVGWGQPFALAEQFNRRSTFIAAYRLAKDRNMGNPAEFARRAVLETQFVYTKANKPQWARGTIGGTLFTFKTYSVSYLELMQRMWTQGGPEGKRAVAWAMVMLMLMGGAGGLPFMEDAEDLIDGMGQMMGYNISAKEWRKQAMADVLGQELAGFLEQGVSGLPGAPIDVSGRLGMGNLIPGTGLFLNKQSSTRDVVEMMGPAGDLVSRGFTAGKDVLAGVIGADLGRIGKGAMELAPNAVRNAAKGVDMMASGMYKDTRGNKIIDTTLDEALWKMIGFQPGSVAQAQEGAQFQQRTRSFYTQTSNEIRQEWARAVFNKDERALERVRDRLSNWNEQNPELQIRINMADILKRVNNMKKDRAQRMADTAPRAMRQQMQEWAAQQR